MEQPRTTKVLLDISPIANTMVMRGIGATQVTGLIRMRNCLFERGVTLSTTVGGRSTWRGIDPDEDVAVEVTVDDFDHTRRLLELQGIRATHYREYLINTWAIGNVRLTVFQWPQIPPYLRVEGPADEVQALATEREWPEHLIHDLDGPSDVFAQYGLDFDAITDLVFDQMPPGSGV